LSSENRVQKISGMMPEVLWHFAFQ
jgi:hypothetical protein